ncbi:hypothetical protein BDA99DRAFT_501702 [Phascolomyces articulosus]|uniref:Uncharacterized protein n=1 Tax=Phascolomyces articulosus TaxID=60185 RepID=A0AAD5K5D3_9FUNG|nr:hypothetical protein BDA99DRAFT_501702 [Phascolomyces articulosus]
MVCLFLQFVISWFGTQHSHQNAGSIIGFISVQFERTHTHFLQKKGTTENIDY